MVLVCSLSIFSCSSSDDEDPGPSIDTTPFIATIGSTKQDQGTAIATDASGNVFVAGTYVNDLKVGSTDLDSDEDGGYNVFLVKYNSVGEPQWAKSAVTEDGQMIATGISLDGDGNIYVTGNFTVDATFGDTKQTGGEANDIFLAKYSKDGAFQWVKTFGSEGADTSFEIRTDASGNTYMTGSFMGEISFGETTLTSLGDGDIFLAKINKDGNTTWAVHVGGGAGYDKGQGIIIDNSFVYITGTTTNNVKINGSDFTGSGTMMIVAKYGVGGDFNWAKRPAGTHTAGSSITVDSQGSVYIIGTLYAKATFGAYSVPVTEFHYAFVSKFSSSGAVQWAKPFPGDGGELTIATGPSDKIYVVGRFSGSVSFNASTQYTSAGYVDVYLARIANSDGVVDWSMTGGGTDFDLPGSAAVDAAGNLYTTGFFLGSATFTPSVTITSTGLHDAFVWKVHP
jgi:hypothetical protein